MNNPLEDLEKFVSQHEVAIAVGCCVVWTAVVYSKSYDYGWASCENMVLGIISNGDKLIGA